MDWESLRSVAHAWECNPGQFSSRALRECCSWLSGEEERHARELRTDRLRHDYLTGRLLCRVVLSSYAGIEPRRWNFGTGLYGKPYVLEPVEFRSLHFSLTRTRGLVVCLVSLLGEVGVDAEDTSQPVDVERVARHFLSPVEHARLSSLPARRRTARFFEQWVAKEAYIKATGRGLAHSPDRLTIGFGEDGRPIAIDGWQISLHRPSPNHVAATAVRPPCGMAALSVRWMPAGALFERRVPVER
jgi:4'-phosphopantetheinyl transferase